MRIKIDTCANFILLSILVAGYIPGKTQDAAELDRRNGFKTIKLAGPIDSVKGAVFKKEFKEKNEFPAKLYEVENKEYSTIGEVNVKGIQVMTYKALIYKIVVLTEKDPRVMRALEKSFGKAAYAARAGTYDWGSENLSLTFRANKSSIELVYRSKPVIKKMAEDKGKKIDEIAKDF